MQKSKISYVDVKADILKKITDGVWPPGSSVPNEMELAEAYSCARATVNRAMRELAEEGLLERKRKAGTRVRRSPLRQATFDIPIVRNEIEKSGSQYRYVLVAREVHVAPEWIRARLGLADHGKVLHLICMHYSDGIPFQHEDRWINLGALPEAATADFGSLGPNEWLIATVPFSNAEISFSATPASESMTHHMGCRPGEALFLTERSTWWQEEAITYVRLTFKPGYRMTSRY